MPPPSNIALLTHSHKAIAAKRRARKDQPKDVVFDEEARREFLTGFHKRKVARTEAAKKKALERQKQERRDARSEHRRTLRERAQENAAQIEKAYGGDLGDEWTGIHTSGSEIPDEDDREYEGEEHLATVTIIEDFDLDLFKHAGKPITEKDEAASNSNTNQEEGSSEVRHRTKQEFLKQRARRVNKVEAMERTINKMARKARTKR